LLCGAPGVIKPLHPVEVEHLFSPYIVLDCRACDFGYPIGIDETRNAEQCKIEIKPNPFRSRVDIRCQIIAGVVTRQYSVGSINIFDITGKVVKRLLLPATNHILAPVVSWDGTDEDGKPARSGIYFCELRIGVAIATAKFILAK